MDPVGQLLSCRQAVQAEGAPPAPDEDELDEADVVTAPDDVAPPWPAVVAPPTPEAPPAACPELEEPWVVAPNVPVPPLEPHASSSAAGAAVRQTARK